ncbi:FAD-binding oxidoreductase [Emcibacter sp.]|uniref:NAD(P)/FAD-dependent oxidoreductase n=1 Tax=Emcibacter sp. TaxID=1979954 RepID=UPI002AA87244|nr:FAD-binding oxidoreductase [Emcibacter sp.]
MAEKHCPSYYAATVNDTSRYPSLEGETSADICVIGGGFTGIATALTLAERGFQVVVLEANQVGWGASGRNGGQMIHAISGEDNLRRSQGPAAEKLIHDIKWRGNEIIRERVEKYNIQCDLKYGYMDAAVKNRHMDHLRKEYDYFSANGLEEHFRLVEARDMADYVGTDSYCGGLYNDLDGHLHPLNLCLGEARAFSSLGGRIYEDSAVIDIEHGLTPVVKTATGQVRANKVVLAGNAYHHLERKHLRGFLFPAGTYILATEPLSEEMARQVLPRDQAVCDLNELLDYYRLSADRRMLYGGRCNYSGRDPKSIKDNMLPRMLKTFPQLKDARIDYEWGGKIGIIINRTPHVGRINDNIYYSEGYSGHGVNTTHIIGEILSDATSGQMERFDIFAKAKHTRLPVPGGLGNQIIALGMLYYRIKDIF